MLYESFISSRLLETHPCTGRGRTKFLPNRLENASSPIPPGYPHVAVRILRLVALFYGTAVTQLSHSSKLRKNRNKKNNKKLQKEFREKKRLNFAVRVLHQFAAAGDTPMYWEGAH